MPCRPAFGAALPALVLLTGMTASAPARAELAGVAPAVLWFVLGQATALSVMLVLVWKQLRGRALPQRNWQAYALATGVSLPLCLWLVGWWPALALALALPVLVWGIVLFLRLARRMRGLLDERDHARAETKRVQRDSERDALTGALNRGAWRQRLEQLAADGLSARPPRPLSVLFFDIDLFKLINDSLGHGVGDDCLKVVSATVSAELRGGDLLGRMGGEEFAVVLPGASRTHGIAVGERIRMAVQEHCRVVGEEVVELTVSIGVAEYLGESESLDVLLDRADRAMYSAKDSGRNMVVADPATPAPL
jgi:diguanylate cyclase (GGDEF)-like protein